MSNKRGRAFGFYATMINKTTGDIITAGVTAEISKDGAANVSSFHTPIHTGNGLWFLLTSDDEADAKQVGAVFIHASAVHQGAQATTVVYDPDDVNGLGLGALELTPDGFIKADIRAIQGLQQPAINLREATNCICTGIVGAGATTNTIPTSVMNPAVVQIEQMRGRVMDFPADTLTLELRGHSTNILAVSILGTFIVDNMPKRAQAGDKFVIT